MMNDLNYSQFLNAFDITFLIICLISIFFGIKNGLLKDKSFLVTGKLNGISRAEVKSLIEENSGTTVSSVSKKLNFLITGDKPTKRKVMRKRVVSREIPEMMTVECPQCSSQIEIPKISGSQELKCPDCGLEGEIDI